MGLFDFLKVPDINQGVAEWKTTEGAVLLDVREPDEYGSGHIDSSINLPLSRIQSVDSVIACKETPVFVHCLSGSRSAQAAQYLKRFGYTNVKNIGGISSYRGKVVQS